MADSAQNLPFFTNGQANPAVTINSVTAGSSPVLIFARDERTSTGLTWGYLGGRWNGTTIANGTVVLTASTTNYIVANIATGVVTNSTNTTNWNNAEYFRLYQVVTDANGPTSWQDFRQVFTTRWSAANITVPVGTLTASATLALTDAGKYIRVDSASAVTVTVPANSSVAFPFGTTITLRRVGAGSVSVAAASGVTITTPGTLNIRKQHSTVQLLKVDTNAWDLMGDVEGAE